MKDIEIVCVPRGIPVDLFGVADVEGPNDLDRAIERLVEERRLRARLTADGRVRLGRRFRALEAVRSGIPVDLFIVLPPAQWGALLAIRTGPAEYSRRLVTACQDRGLRCVDGRLVDIGRVMIGAGRRADLDTPEEADFIRACGLPFVPPEDRHG